MLSLSSVRIESELVSFAAVRPEGSAAHVADRVADLPVLHDEGLRRRGADQRCDGDSGSREREHGASPEGAARPR